MDLTLGQNPAAASVPGQPAGAGAMIMDGDQKTFMQDVVEASRSVPVMVDFWATWCAPCKQLTPTLEKVVRAAGGRVKLVKIDIDRNRALVQQLAQLGLPLQSVPTVAAFWNGQIVDLFQAALPESEVKRFVEALLKLAGGAMPVAEMITEAKAALERGETEEAGAIFSAALQQEPENPEAWGGAMRALIGLGREDEAQAMLDEVPAKIADHAEIVGVRSALALAAEGRRAAEGIENLASRLAANPADHAARYELATALNALGRREEAAAALLEIIRLARGWNEDAARLQLLKFFEAWGVEDPATVAARRRLSAILFA